SRRCLELLLYAINAASECGDAAAHWEAAELAPTLAADGDSEWARLVARLLAGAAAMVAGDDARGTALLDEALATATETDDPHVGLWAAACTLWTGDDVRTAALAARAVSVARQRGAVGILAGSLGTRAAALFLSQQIHEASLAAAEALRLSRETGSENYTPPALRI